MMNNLQSSAFVAKTTQLLSSVARLRLLLVMLLTLTVSANAWGEDYELVSFSDIKTNDVIIIVGTKSGTAYAMKNTGTPPTPIEVTISNSKITSTATDITFTATNNGDNTITFVSTTSGTLYCTNDNNGVKIGSQTGDNTKFSFDSDVKRLKNIGRTRWLGIYNTQDWRCYTSASANNIKDTETTFYRKVTAAPSFTITAQSNNTNYGTVSLSGITITASPETGYRVSTTTPYTISPLGSATVTQSENKFTVTPSANTTITINFEALPKYTVTLNAGPGTCAASVTEASAGEGVTLPTPTLNGCDDWSFAGWATSSVANETSSKPATLLTGSYKPTANTTLYAVYQRTEDGGGSSEYSKLNWGSNIKAGKYLMSTGIYTVTGKNGNKTSELAVVEYTPSTEQKTNYEFTISEPDNDGYFTIKLPDNSCWVGWSTSTSTALSETEPSDDQYLWKYSSNGIQNKEATTRYLQVNGACTAAKVYTTDNPGTNWKHTYLYSFSSGSTIYYHSTPDCSTETVPSLSASVSSLAFGDVTVNSSEELEFTLSGSNLTADATLALSGTNAGMFSVSPTPVTPSNGSITNQTITVTYTPTAKASHSATLTISSTDAKSIEISLSGTGVAQMANYTVKHYKQNLDGTYPTEPTETEYSSGEVGTLVTPAVKSYEGFTAPTEEKSVEITTDGNAIVEYQYARNSYTLTWNLDGGNIKTAGTAAGLVKYGASLTAPVVEKDGFNFKGWSPSVPTTMPAADATYTAQWKQVYTITWLVEGQPYTIGNPTTTVEEGQNITAIPSDPPLLTCAVKFMGWSIESSGSTPEDPSYYSDLFTTLDEAKVISINEDMTFHAVFATKEDGIQSESVTVTKESFSAVDGTLDENISYDSQQGNGTAAPIISNNAIRLYQNTSGKTGGYIILSAENDCKITSASITSTSKSTTGYIFSNTTYAPNKDDFIVNDYPISANGTYTVSELNTSYITFACFGTTSDTRLHISKISVTYIKEGDPAYSAYITSCCETPAPTNGTYTNVTGSGSSMSVKLTWEDAANAGSYHITGENLADDVDATNYTVSGLTECETYTFYVSAHPTEGCESPKLAIEVTPYIPKTVTFVDGSTTTQKTTSCGSETVTVPNASKECYTSVWKDQSGNEYTNNQEFTPTENLTLTADYTIIQYEITFVDEDGTNILQSSTVDCGTTPSYTGETPTKDADAVYQYTFAAWSPAIVPANDNATYTATYNKTKRTYTVDWYVNGKLVKNETVEAGELATAPDLSKIPCGAVLAGWTDAPNGEYVHETSTLYPGEEPSIEILENKTLYAVFADIDE